MYPKICFVKICTYTKVTINVVRTGIMMYIIIKLVQKYISWRNFLLLFWEEADMIAGVGNQNTNRETGMMDI